MRKLVWAALCSSLVAACGGGGDGGTPLPAPLTITTVNQDAVATTAAAAMLSVSSAGGVTASGSAGPAAIGAASRRVALRLADSRKHAAAANVQPLVIPPEVENCPAGGTATLSYQDTNDSGDLDMGEGITFTFANCKQTASDSLDGSIAVTIASAGPSAGGIQFTGTMTVTNLVAVDGTRSAGLSGSASMAYEDQTATQTRIALTVGAAGLTSSVTLGAQNSETITFEPGFAYVETMTTDANGSPLQTSSTVNGGFRSDALGGRVILETQQQIVQSANAPYPGSGAVRVVGTNSALRLTVLDTATVRQELDTNGDGTYDTSKDVPWTTLLPT